MWGDLGLLFYAYVDDRRPSRHAVVTWSGDDRHVTPDSVNGSTAGMRRNHRHTMVCVLTIRADEEHLVYTARYGLDRPSASAAQTLKTVDLDEVVILLQDLSNELRSLA